MKSLYQNKQFAEYWNKRAGESGEIYKSYVLDPIMFKLVGSFFHKTVVELGCGNGYLAQKFMENGVRKLILLDISKYNLKFAREKCRSKNVEFVEQDATNAWKVRTDSVDIIYSNMMLNEVANIKTPVSEASRVLRKSGTLIFSVTHPAWDLYVFAQEKCGMKSDKIKNLGNYFRKGYAQYIMGVDNKINPKLAKKHDWKFKVEHYQRPLSDYFNTLTEMGFTVKKIVEPQLTPELLKKNPRFAYYKDHPIGLIFYCKKE